jgi:hypothetical protein
MKRIFALLALLAAALWSAPAFSEAWVTPTAEELHMSAPAEDPSANAVYLSYDERDDDQLNVHTYSVRLKVLTQAGVERYADVEVGLPERHFAVQNVEARTVHADGSIVPFTGKPYLKTLHRRDYAYKATVFSMPDVQVGSIIEYRYRLGYDDNLLMPARWYVQHDAYALHEHYIFKPFDQSGNRYIMIDHGQVSHGLFYVNSLPREAQILPDNGGGHKYYELTVNNVPALPDEDALPPTHSLSYRMLFYYAAQFKSDAYWATEGKFISKDINNFASAGSKMKSDLPSLLGAADAPEVEAKKLYLAVMKIENTDFTREHSRDEDKAQGLRAVKTAEDVWVRQRGSSDEIALTYLAFLRAAGISAFGMRVTNRDLNIFQPAFIDTSQLNDMIVIANLNGKEVYLDPGSRFCPYGQLAWKHSWASGLRQLADGTQIAQSGGLNYKDTMETRTAMLDVTDQGDASGTVTLSYTGQVAMLLRQRETGEAPDDTKHRFEQELRTMLPGGMQLHVITMSNLDDGEKPLVIVFGVRGAIGTVSGHRLLVNTALLRFDETERFTSATRKNSIYFHYPYIAADAVLLHLDPSIKLEAVPEEQKAALMGSMAYSLKVVSAGDKVKLMRTVAINGVIVPTADYPKLREFFGNLRSADENQVLFVREPAAASSGRGAPVATTN